MDWHNFGSVCEGSSEGQTCRIMKKREKEAKPLEIYIYIDPVHPESWTLDGIVKKLVIEYGNYFTLRYVICITQYTMELAQGKKTANQKSSKVSALAVIEDQRFLTDESRSPYRAALAIKTAELQGKSAGKRFLRHFHERLHLEPEHILTNRVLLDCASLAKLDLDEFKKDFYSKSPITALYCDQKLSAEMDVRECPTLVLFNIRDDQEGLKISGHYPYPVYVQLLTEALGQQPTADAPPELIEYMRRYQFADTEEIALIYDMNAQETLREMKKLKLKQQVEPVTTKDGLFWRYTGG